MHFIYTFAPTRKIHYHMIFCFLHVKWPLLFTDLGFRVQDEDAVLLNIFIINFFWGCFFFSVIYSDFWLQFQPWKFFHILDPAVVGKACLLKGVKSQGVGVRTIIFLHLIVYVYNCVPPLEWMVT